MKIVLSILLILATLLGLLQMFQWYGGAAGAIYWRDHRIVEERRLAGDKHTFQRAVDHYLANAQHAQSVSSGEAARERAALERELDVLRIFAQEAEDAEKQIVDAFRQLDKAIADVEQEVPDNYKKVMDALRSAVNSQVSRKDTYRNQIAALLQEVSQARTNYAVNYEKLLLLEYNQYLLQEDLQRQREVLYRYRWLRPDMQEEIGDAGKFVSGKVTFATGYAVQIDKGQRDGVELYQKFTVMRNERVIAVIDIVEVRNDSAEGEIRQHFAKEAGLVPQPGDVVVPRRFMPTLGRPDLKARGLE